MVRLNCLILFISHKITFEWKNHKQVDRRLLGSISWPKAQFSSVTHNFICQGRGANLANHDIKNVLWFSLVETFTHYVL